MHARAEKHGKPAAHAAKGHTTLGQLAATAICGNDITSSCLYVSALAILYAGPLAPLALLLVAVVLYLFRAIYAEVVGALPLNGDAYNALLNTTTKFRASVAACLTILSYMATAVISANEAVHYVHDLWAALPITGSTIGLLATFCGLTILGISDSARVAIVMGSSSDWPTMSRAAEVLERLDVPHDCRVLSAHRTPAAATAFASEAEERGMEVVIAADAESAADIAASVVARVLAERPAVCCQISGPVVS